MTHFIATAGNVDETELYSFIIGEMQGGGYSHDSKVYRVDLGYAVVPFNQDGPEDGDYLGMMEELAADEGIE